MLESCWNDKYTSSCFEIKSIIYIIICFNIHAIAFHPLCDDVWDSIYWWMTYIQGNLCASHTFFNVSLKTLSKFKMLFLLTPFLSSEDTKWKRMYRSSKAHSGLPDLLETQAAILQIEWIYPINISTEAMTFIPWRTSPENLSSFPATL